MSVEVAKLIQPEIEALVRSGDGGELRKALQDLHAADIESVISQFEAEDQVTIFNALELEQQIEVFGYFSLDLQQDLIDLLPQDTRQAVLNEARPDDRAELFDQLPDELSEQLLGELTTNERDATLELLSRDENSAGRMMTPEFLTISARDTVEHAFEKVRKSAESVETVYVAYVTDSEGKLVGTTSLRDLLRARSSDLVKHLMTTDPIHCTVDTDQESLAALMKKYDLIALPVVDDKNTMLGIVTFDDIHDVVDEEASEDILRMHGVAAAADSYFDASVGRKLSQRMVVLTALAFVSFASVLIQREFNHIIAQVSILAIYLTLLMGSSGNCGTQVAGIIIRAQSIALDPKRLKRIVGREIIVGVLMALLMATLAASLVFLFGVDERAALGGHSTTWLATVVGTAMFTAITTINLLGGVIPLAMKRIGLDPAIAAGPFITTMADILTVLIYFNIAAWMLSVN